jgi:hypothetical protein
MAGAPWNILDSRGCRIALCGGDSSAEWERFGPAIAAVIVAALNRSQLPADELAPPIDPPWLRERIKLEVDTAISRQAADELAKVREENKLLRDELQAHAEVSLAAIDARAQTEHELAAAEARIEELERENRDLRAKHYEQPWTVNEAEQLRQRATVAEAERDRLREAFLKEPTDEAHN